MTGSTDICLVVELVVGGMQQLVLVGDKDVGGGHYLVSGRSVRAQLVVDEDGHLLLEGVAGPQREA